MRRLALALALPHAPRRVLTTSALVVASALLLAGCAQDVAPAAVESAPPLVLVTEENDLESLVNDSFMMAAHQHDYWGGKERLTVVEKALDEGTTVVGSSWGLPFVPEDGIVVPQGTAKIEVTITWIDEGTVFYSDPELALKTAVDDVPVVIGPVQSGATLTVPVAIAQTDLPHQSISAWRFVWRLNAGIVPVDGLGGGVLWEGNVSMKVDAIRGADIPIYPPHPDLWDGRETIPLFDITRGPALWMGSPDDWNCLRSCPARLSPDNGTVVPFDSATVRVVLDPHADVPVELGLLYHDGLTRAWTELTPNSTEGGRRLYEIPVPMGGGDSPYALQSVWEFFVFVAGPERDSVMVGTYSLSAEAMRAVSSAIQ